MDGTGREAAGKWWEVRGSERHCSKRDDEHPAQTRLRTTRVC